MSAAHDYEADLREAVAKTWDDPLAHTMLVFPWGEKNTALEHHDGPDQWQREQMIQIRDWIRSGNETALRDATASGHGVGKSTESAFLAYWFMGTRPHCSGVVTANTQAQLKSKTWRELSLWHKRAINKHWFTWTATRFFARESPETWGIDAIPWSEHNPEAFAGLHAQDVLVIYDEASAIADPIWEVTAGAMTTPGAMWFVYGNPTRNDGEFRRAFGSQAHRWQTRNIDARTAKMVNRAEIDQWVEDYGEDSDFVRVRVRGLFPRLSSSQLISPDAVTAGRNNEIERNIYGRYPKLIGVDPARYGDDRSVVIARQGPKAWMPKVFREIETSDLAGHAMELYSEWGADAICVDGNGIGAGVVDQLDGLAPIVDVQFAARASDPRAFLNIRAQAWWRMREWVHGEVDLPDSQDLEEDMLAPQYMYDNRMRLQIEPKEAIKKRSLASPDSAEALATTMVDEAIRAGLTQGRHQGARPIRRRSAKGWT